MCMSRVKTMKNVVMTMLLMLLMMAVFIHASQALKCYECGLCDDPIASQTCDSGDVCIKLSNQAGTFRFYGIKMAIHSTVCFSVLLYKQILGEVHGT